MRFELAGIAEGRLSVLEDYGFHGPGGFQLWLRGWLSARACVTGVRKLARWAMSWGSSSGRPEGRALWWTDSRRLRNAAHWVCLSGWEIGGQYTELPLAVVCCGGMWERIVESVGHRPRYHQETARSKAE